MKSNNNLPLVESIIRNSGFIVMERPSIDHPIPVAVSYRTNRDGSLRWLWPEGSHQVEFSKCYTIRPAKPKWTSALNKICFAIGLGSLIAHGRCILYADLPTATYIRCQWLKN